jgi:diguanylate cyclase (GGDEF)-like protein
VTPRIESPLHFRALANELIARQPHDEPETLRCAGRVAAFSLAMLVWVPVFAVIYTALAAPVCSNIILFGGMLLLGVLLLLRRGVAPEICGNLLTLAAWYVYTALALLTGGLAAPVMVWYSTLPILSVLLSGARSGIFWTAASALTVGAFAVVQEAGLRLPIEVTAWGLRVLQLAGLVGLLSCVYLLVSVLKKLEFGARQALYDANRRLAQQALTDALTGIPNRHRFDQVLKQEWACHNRAAAPLSLALVDADYFKSFNDEYGHLAGDECLRAVAGAIQATICRPRDFCARFGGEEFVIILPDTDEQGALRIAELIQAQVAGLRIGHISSTVSRYVTVSIGLATTIPGRDRSHLDFLYDVDMALYRAKEKGRDRIIQVVAAATLTV